MIKEKYRILSLEGCDIYRESQRKGEGAGYILPEQNSFQWKKCFSNQLNFCLDGMELKEQFLKRIGRKYSLKDEDGFLYTLAVVNVGFKYRYVSEKTSISRAQLREIIYREGFTVNGEKYVRYKRSSGSSREGKCLFIMEKLLPYMEKWGECGLVPPDRCDLVSWESYKALSLSSLKGLVKIPPEGILFVDDYKSTFQEEVIGVSYQDGIKSELQTGEISNNIWDGEALLDESVFTEEFKDKHMLLLRNKFFKSCAFKTKLQKWFRDNQITSVAQLNDAGCVTLANEVSQIVMVTTASSLKYLKFAGGKLTKKNIKEWAKKISEDFGVVKFDKRTKFFDGDKVQTSYQLLNTVGLSEEESAEFIHDNLELMKSMRDDPVVLRHYITHLVQREKEEEENEFESDMTDRGEILFSLMDKNERFRKTKLYYRFRNDFIDSFRDNMKRGRFLVDGTYATLFGNGPELLKRVIGKFSEEDRTLSGGEIRCLKFDDGKELLCARSPHITMGNLYLVKNKTTDPVWDYFDLGEQIVCVNAIRENIQQRLNGCDYDSDTMLITDNELLVKKTKEHYSKFKVPVCLIQEEKNDIDNLATIDHMTGVNKIGEIVNLSQRLNSYYWDRLHHGAEAEECQKIYEDVCILAVLSGIEIDRAKRSYPVQSMKVIRYIRKKYAQIQRIRPYFFKFLDEEKQQHRKQEKEDQKREKRIYVKHDTAMDYIVYAVVHHNFKEGKEKVLNFVPVFELFRAPKKALNKTHYNHRDKIVSVCMQYADILTSLYQLLRVNDQETQEVIWENIKKIKQNRDQKILSLIDSKETLYLTLKQLEKEDFCLKEKNRVREWLFYAALLQKGNPYLEELIKNEGAKLPRLAEKSDGDITLCGRKYRKV